MRSWTFILNPSAGYGMRRRLNTKIEQRIRAGFPEAEIIIARYAGHATQLAAEQKHDRDRTVVAVGGDGTVHEVANGLIGGSASLGMAPVGSGNDYARMFALSGRIDRALEQLRHGRERAVDVGRAAIEAENGSETERYFVNGMGIGFDAEVANRARGSTILKGAAMYLAAALPLLFRYRNACMCVALDGESFSGRYFLIAAGNGKCVGGGFRLTPGARLDDGLLEICLVNALSPGRALWMLPSAIRGSHGRYPEVRFCGSGSLRVETSGGVMVHLDGEVIATAARRIRAEILPGVLKVRA